MEDAAATALEARWAEAIAGLPTGRDDELEQVIDWFRRADPTGFRMATVLRESLDRIYDGPRTGHFRLSDKRKTEKTHTGTVVEIEVAREYELDARDEDPTDYRIDDILVDCKFSKDEHGWMIPVEAWGHIVLLLWADDELGLFSGGLWRVDPRALTGGKNRDLKRSILARHRLGIRYLWQRQPMPKNTLLHLPQNILNDIFQYGHRGGQKRVNMLFRRVQREIIRREVVLTVALQRDGLRRARMAREPKRLGREGIIVLGHYRWDVQVAESLGLPVPQSGEWVSTRVVPTIAGDTAPTFEADGAYWRQATPDDPVVSAPRIPRAEPLDEDEA